MPIVNYEFVMFEFGNTINKEAEIYIAIPDEYDDVLLQLIISVIAAEIVEYYCWHMSSRMEIYIIDKHIDEFDAWAINIDNECFFNNTKKYTNGGMLKKISNIYYILKEVKNNEQINDPRFRNSMLWYSNKITEEANKKIDGWLMDLQGYKFSNNLTEYVREIGSILSINLTL